MLSISVSVPSTGLAIQAIEGGPLSVHQIPVFSLLAALVKRYLQEGHKPGTLQCHKLRGIWFYLFNHQSKSEDQIFSKTRLKD